MNAGEVRRIVDSLHRDKNIPKEIVFGAIESALVSAARKHFGEEADIEFNIDREDGTIIGRCGQEELDYEDVVGRIGAQTAKQVIIQKVREAERDAQMVEFDQQINEIISGTVHRSEGSVTTVTLGSVEAILPRSEQIPGEHYQPNDRIRAVVTEVKAQGSRIKVVLSRTRGVLVQRLFEQEIPEIADGVISINAIAREPGYRTKLAVSSIDSKVDCVGACVGVRGTRIKSIIDELSNERIDIVRYDEDPQIMIRNALQPAEVDEVILCKEMGRAIVLVAEDQLSLAIGKRGQNVRLASKLCKWDIEIMTQEELEKQIERAVEGFSILEGVDEDLANMLVGEGFLSYDDLEVIEPDFLMNLGSLTMEQVDAIVAQAEVKAEEAEKASQEKRRQQREQKDRDAQMAREAQAAAAAAAAAEKTKEASSPGESSTAEADGASTDSVTASPESGDAV
ncbi:MAG: transcription termination factor NusA [Planctomycetaceae bacterium]|nr:transcription termination factor NusA [Planctomycetaceae bacterium]